MSKKTSQECLGPSEVALGTKNTHKMITECSNESLVTTIKQADKKTWTR